MGALGTMLGYSFKAGRYIGTKDTETKAIADLNEKMSALHDRFDGVSTTLREFAGSIGELRGAISRINGGHK